jgi:hypothetical protein
VARDVADLIAQVETIRDQLGCGQAGSPSGAFVDDGARR